MQYKQLDADDLQFFKTVVGEAFCILDEETLNRFGSDHTEDLHYPPEVVLRAGSPDDVCAIMGYCNAHSIPVTPRGAGTGLSGGALPVFGGVCLDMSRFNKILLVDKQNFQVVTEPGVITQVLQEAVLEAGMFYPPDPASKGSCFIGGNVAENSGGPRAVKYGVVKDYVLNLEIVLPDGTLMWTGANVLKNATGYNLTQLITGSEGTLAVITKIVLRLIPAVHHDITLLVPFRDAGEACAAVNSILMAGIIPSALEFMERDALDWSMRYTGNNAIEIPADIAAHLLIELDGNDRDQLYTQAEAVTLIVEQYNIGQVLIADNTADKQMLWALRRKVGEAVKANSVYKEEDTVVPRAKLPELLRVVKQLGKDYGFQSVCYGHAGDGNLHVNIVKGDLSFEDWNIKVPTAIRLLFTEVVKMGGTISGEHGIGLVQKDYLSIAFSESQVNLMYAIKRVFDPHLILNPGKIFA